MAKLALTVGAEEDSFEAAARALANCGVVAIATSSVGVAGAMVLARSLEMWGTGVLLVTDISAKSAVAGAAAALGVAGPIRMFDEEWGGARCSHAVGVGAQGDLAIWLGRQNGYTISVEETKTDQVRAEATVRVGCVDWGALALAVTLESIWTASELAETWSRARNGARMGSDDSTLALITRLCERVVD